MIELALGAAAAALFAKAIDRAGEKAVDQGEGALQRLVELVRNRLSKTDHEEGSNALEKVEDAPDSPSRVEALAHVLNQQAEADPEFRRELEAMVKEANGNGIDVGNIVQATYGNQSPSFGFVSGEVKLNYGGVSPTEGPRRISD